MSIEADSIDTPQVIASTRARPLQLQRSIEWPRMYGAYGEVFRCGDRAIKVFFQRSDDLARKAFDSEVAAYQRVSQVPTLQAITPAFFGVVEVQDVLDARGVSIARDFCSPLLAYEMSFVEGTFVKIGSISGPQRDSVRQLFGKYGINYTIDCSMTLGNDGRVACVIDFATEGFEAEHPPNIFI
jgi:hypothetical protein